MTRSVQRFSQTSVYLFDGYRPAAQQDQCPVGMGNASSSHLTRKHLTPEFFLWHQAFDADTQEYYYYCQSMHVTQWQPPLTGFIPLRRRGHDEVEHISKCTRHALHRDVPHAKYWSQRHRLFSLFDHGIRLDAESWFSITPECIAQHQARRCLAALRRVASGAIETRVTESSNQMTVLDAFCGVGGNTIAFARNSNVRVIAFDIDESRLLSASHNACIYGVRKAVRFAQCDAVSAMQDAVLHRKLLENVDMIFLSPPWGGPEYISVDSFDLGAIFVSGKSLLDVLRVALALTPNVAFFLPRNSNLQPIFDTFDVHFEVERNYLNGKLKSITLYFGQLAAL